MNKETTKTTAHADANCIQAVGLVNYRRFIHVVPLGRPFVTTIDFVKNLSPGLLQK